MLLQNLSGRSFTDIFQLSSDASNSDINKVNAGINLLLEAGLDGNLPSVQAIVDADATASFTQVGDRFSANIELDQLLFKDVGIRLGSFINKQLGRVIDIVHGFLEPIKPLIAIIKSEVPGVTQLSEALGNGRVTFLDLALQQIEDPQQARDARRFVDVVDGLIALVDTLKTLEEDRLVILLEEFNVLTNMTTATDNQVQSLFSRLESTSLQRQQAQQQIDSVGGPIGSLLQRLDGIGLQLDLIEEPSNIVNLLLNRNFQIASWFLPRFELPFTWETTIPIFAPPTINARIGLDASIFAEIGIGIDSHGLQTTGRFLDGFHFVDLNQEGVDIAEIGLSLGVRLAALLDIGFANAGIEGEIRSDLEANIRDVSGDGRLHLDEANRIVHADGVDCLFDLSGEIRAIVRLLWEVRFLGSGSVEFIDEVLLRLENECPHYELGHVVEGAASERTIASGPAAPDVPGTLVLHAGPNASQRRGGITTDVAEQFVVEQLAPGVVEVRALGLMNRYSGVKEIYFHGGAFDDQLILQNVDVPVTALGGIGNDILVGTRHEDYLKGGAGDDLIVGRGNGDRLYGNGGDDTIYSELLPLPSDDPFFADEGIHQEAVTNVDLFQWRNDVWLGNTSIPEHTIRGGRGDDLILGADGVDTILGNSGFDLIIAAAGNDIVDAGPDGDFVIGNVGDDELVGGSGNDLISGGVGTDIISGGADHDILIGWHAVYASLARNELIAESFLDSFNSRLDSPFVDDDEFDANERFIEYLKTDRFLDSLVPDVNDGVQGNTGNDLLIGDSGFDDLFGGWGNDILIANRIGDVGIVDNASNDFEYLEGGPDNDFICGSANMDTVHGGTTDLGIDDVLAQAGSLIVSGGFSVTSCVEVPVPVGPGALSTISGTVFNDIDVPDNEFGIQDADENGVEGIVVELQDQASEVVATTTTDVDGNYQFSSLVAGNYIVEQQLTPGFRQTTTGGQILRDIATDPSNGDSYAVSGDGLFQLDSDERWRRVGSFGNKLITSIAIGPNSEIYAMGPNSGVLYSIDATDASLTRVLDVGDGAAGGLVFHPIDNLLYGSTGNSLFSVDILQQLQFEDIGLHEQTTSLFGLQVTSTGLLVAATSGLDLFAIDRESGNASPVLANEDLSSLDERLFDKPEIGAGDANEVVFNLNIYPGQKRRECRLW